MTMSILNESDEPDMYGQVHPKETEELIAEKLAEFDAQVDQVPASEKESVLMAMEKCPDQLTNEFKLQFLRCEVFKTEKAVKRYLKFWDKRREIAGDGKAFMKPTLGSEGPLSEDEVAMAQGLLQVLPHKDPSGRTILFMDTSRQHWDQISIYNMARACAYILMTALQDETTQRKGIVLVSWTAREKFYQMNRQFITLMASSVKGALPVRLSGVHVCQPNFFFRIVYPLACMFLGDRLSKRIRLHPGKVEDLHKTLAPYGLTQELLPTELGGKVVLDIEKWIAKQKMEGK